MLWTPPLTLLVCWLGVGSSASGIVLCTTSSTCSSMGATQPNPGCGPSSGETVRPAGAAPCGMSTAGVTQQRHVQDRERREKREPLATLLTKPCSENRPGKRPLTTGGGGTCMDRNRREKVKRQKEQSAGWRTWEAHRSSNRTHAQPAMACLGSAGCKGLPQCRAAPSSQSLCSFRSPDEGGDEPDQSCRHGSEAQVCTAGFNWRCAS